MRKRLYFLLATSILWLIAVPGAFGSNVIYPCSPLTLSTDSDYLATCPGVTSLPPAGVIAIKLYLTSGFTDGIPNVNGSVQLNVYFLPQTAGVTWSGGLGSSCVMTNGGLGTTLVTNSCGMYSGNPTAPGTSYLLADDNLAALATTGFEILSLRAYVNGTARSVQAQNFVEYIYTPEPPLSFLFGISLIVLGWLVRRSSKSQVRDSGRHHS